MENRAPVEGRPRRAPRWRAPRLPALPRSIPDDNSNDDNDSHNNNVNTNHNNDSIIMAGEELTVFYTEVRQPVKARASRAASPIM